MIPIVMGSPSRLTFSVISHGGQYDEQDSESAAVGVFLCDGEKADPRHRKGSAEYRPWPGHRLCQDRHVNRDENDCHVLNQRCNPRVNQTQTVHLKQHADGI